MILKYCNKGITEVQKQRWQAFPDHFQRRCFASNTVRFRQLVTRSDIEQYNFNSTRDVIPLYQYFLKFSYFKVELPPINAHLCQSNDKDYFPLQYLQCSWNYTDNYKSLFGDGSQAKKKLAMSEFEFMTAWALVKYLRRFPFAVYTSDELIDVESEDQYRNVDKIADIDTLYYRMFEEKCDDEMLMHMNVPLAKQVIKELIRQYKVNVNGHSIDRSTFFIKANDEIIFDIPRHALNENCSRRLLEYLFKVYRIYSRKNDAIEQFMNSSQLRTIVKKTKNLSKYPSQSMEVIQKLCIQRFTDNLVHSIRHCIIPNDCGHSPSDKSQIIIYEDEDIIACNKPAGMAVHFAKETQKYHSSSLINFLLYYCDDLRYNLQKDSHLFKSSKLRNYNILPNIINELQLTIAPGMVHRIDRQTSGVIVLGKTIFAMSNLLKQWKYHEKIEREYLTLVHGKFDGNALRLMFDNEAYDPEDDDVDQYDDIYSSDVTYSTFYEDEEYEELYGEHYSKIKQKHDKMNMQSGHNDNEYYKCECWIGPKLMGRHLPLRCYTTKQYKKKKELMKEDALNPFKISCSHFYKLKEYEVNGHTFTLLKCVLLTGRTHQIRLHLQHLGMAVVGDRVYPRADSTLEGDEERPETRAELRRWKPRSDEDTSVAIDLGIEKQLFNEGECHNIDWYKGDCHALHAHSLKFQHPITEEPLHFQVQVPPFFEHMVHILDKQSK